MKFSLIHPSRSRPEKARATLDKWWGDYMRGHDFEHILSIDSDDPARDKYFELFPYGYTVIINNNRSAVDAVNVAAQIAEGEILIVMSDDFDCPPNWIEIINEATKGKTDWVLKVNCGIQKRIITLPIFDRAYYDRDKRVYNPIYRHAWCDTEFTEVAHLRGRVIVRNDIMFRHLHPEFTKEPKDALYLRNDKTHDEDRHIFEARKKINFGL